MSPDGSTPDEPRTAFERSLEWIASTRDFVGYWDEEVRRMTSIVLKNGTPEEMDHVALGSILAFSTLIEATAKYAAFFDGRPDSPPIGIEQSALTGKAAGEGDIAALKSYDDEAAIRIRGYGNDELAVKVGVPQAVTIRLANANAGALRRAMKFASAWYLDLGYKIAHHRLKHHGGLLILSADALDTSQLRGDPTGIFRCAAVINFDPGAGLDRPKLLPLGPPVLEKMLVMSRILSDGLDEMLSNRLTAVKAGAKRFPPCEP